MYSFKKDVFLVEVIAPHCLFYYFGNRVIIKSEIFCKVAQSFFSFLATPKNLSEITEKFSKELTSEQIQGILENLMKNNFLILGESKASTSKPWGHFLERFCSDQSQLNSVLEKLQSTQLNILVSDFDFEIVQSIASQTGSTKLQVLKSSELHQITSGLTVVFGAWSEQQQLLSWNRFFHEKNLKWFAVLSDFYGGTVTPVFGLTDGPCFHCFAERRLSNTMNIDRYDMLASHFSKSAMNNFQLPLLSSTLASVSLFEATKVLTQFFDTELYRGCMEFDFLNLRWDKHPVLRNPNCEICKPQITQGFYAHHP